MIADICIHPWDYRVEPFRIAAGLYYVGNSDVSSHLIDTGEHLHYSYPPGATLLQVPIAIALRVTGLSVVDDENAYDAKRALSVQRVLAALLMALMALVFDATARRMLDVGGQLKLSGAGERVRLSLTITRLDQRLEIMADEAAALESFGG